MGASGGPNIISDGLVFALDAADPQTSKAGCMGFTSAEQLMKNLATNSGKGDTITSTSDVRLGNLTFYTIYSQTYPEGDHNPDGASGTRDGITPGFNNVTSSELLDFSRDLNYAVWNNKTNGWVADSYFNGERKAGHCYDTYDGEPAQHAQFQSDYEAIVNAFPDATHIVCGSHAAENNDSDSDTLAILKDLGGPSSWPTDRAEYILIGKPGLGAGNAYVWQYQNDSSTRAHANVGLPILGGKKSGGNYLEFDGSSDEIDAGSLGTSGEFSESTISVWFQKDTQVSNYGNVFDCNYNVTTANKGPRMEVDIAGSVVRVYMGTDGGSYTTISFGSLSNNTWYNLVLTVSPNGTGQDLKAYTDGDLINSSTSSSSFLWDGDIADLYLGVGFTSARHFTGKIAAFQIYDKTLTAAQIKANFNTHRRRFGV
tara:strand:+ start:58 stop:1338 length:1281 start_codon:yes stop_codon:yes gene_type:complete